MCACVWRAQVACEQSADDAAGGLLQRLQQHDVAVSALSLLPRSRLFHVWCRIACLRECLGVHGALSHVLA